MPMSQYVGKGFCCCSFLFSFMIPGLVLRAIQMWQLFSHWAISPVHSVRVLDPVWNNAGLSASWAYLAGFHIMPSSCWRIFRVSGFSQIVLNLYRGSENELIYRPLKKTTSSRREESGFSYLGTPFPLVSSPPVCPIPFLSHNFVSSFDCLYYFSLIHTE